jgi:hypothetical protein
MDTATAPQRENRIRAAPMVWYMVISFSVREWDQAASQKASGMTTAISTAYAISMGVSL